MIGSAYEPSAYASKAELYEFGPILPSSWSSNSKWQEFMQGEAKTDRIFSCSY